MKQFESMKKLRLNHIIIVIIVLCVCGCQSVKKELPIYNPSDINPLLVDQSVRSVTDNHFIADFSLINQNGDTITQDNYQDKIYVTDFFFTRCQSICPIMTGNMARIQEVFINNDIVMLLSLSVTPVMDSVPVLRSYADRKGVIDSKWNITTGNKKHIYELARKSFFAVLDEGDGGMQDFIHTEKFVLIDKNKQIRGFYDGTVIADINRLIRDINILLD